MKTVKFKAIVLTSLEECDILINDLEAGYVAAMETKEDQSAKTRQTLIGIVETMRDELKRNRL